MLRLLVPDVRSKFAMESQGDSIDISQLKRAALGLTVSYHVQVAMSLRYTNQLSYTSLGE